MIICVLQRFRFSTSLVYAVAVGLEFLTPLAPRYFLLLASIANVGKSVGLATHISTQPSFVKNFARQDNLSDLTAKAQVTHQSQPLSLSLLLAASQHCQCQQVCGQLTSQPSFVKNFARQDNLSDLTVKAQVTNDAEFSYVYAWAPDDFNPSSNRPSSFLSLNEL